MTVMTLIHCISQFLTRSHLTEAQLAHAHIPEIPLHAEIPPNSFVTARSVRFQNSLPFSTLSPPLLCRAGAIVRSLFGLTSPSLVLCSFPGHIHNGHHRVPHPQYPLSALNHHHGTILYHQHLSPLFYLIHHNHHSSLAFRPLHHNCHLLRGHILCQHILHRHQPLYLTHTPIQHHLRCRLLKPCQHNLSTTHPLCNRHHQPHRLHQLCKHHNHNHISSKLLFMATTFKASGSHTLSFHLLLTHRHIKHQPHPPLLLRLQHPPRRGGTHAARSGRFARPPTSQSYSGHH